MTDLKSYFHDKYKGGEDFIENVILPIFGEDKYENAFEEDVLDNNPELIRMADTLGISQVLRLGTIDIPMNPTDVFDITVSNHVQMERNRVAIQTLVRRIMSTFSSAFMVFHYNDDTRWDWRFTFCSKQGSNKDTTDSKRYTFLFGPNQSCRTAADNFNKLAAKHGDIDLDDIIKAFDVEALSKEFFTKYKEQYEKFCNYVYVNKHNRNLFGVEFSQWEDKKIRDYVKKLLGRIVFLHFLQKKGWMGVPGDKEWGEGDQQFMRNLFKNATPKQKANYLDEVLEPLFADALDTDRTSDDDMYDTGVEGYRNIQIPYLNGGLFEKDELDVPKSTFPADYFHDLFEFFYQYNFTIDENDPNDAQVGVDPEMLGRIFENLLEDNKDKGAFYTPKEIVQYMCKESLIAYLFTKISDSDEEKQYLRNFVETHDVEAFEERLVEWEDGREDTMANYIDNCLKEVKICDPAIGSGAFPMGLLKEIFYCRMAIEKFTDAAEIKKHIIQQNIYGVDIEKGAVDIARLRFWLALIVDELTPHALPNMDFKIMQGNSLLEQYKGVDLSDLSYHKTKKDKKVGVQLSWFDNQADFSKKQFSIKMKEYFGCNDRERKNQLRKDIKQLVEQQLEALEIRVDMSNIKDIAATSEFFLWHTWFSDVFEEGGFDIVIGNPPYIQLQADNGFLGKMYQGKGFETFNSMGDIYCLFYEHGINLLKENGTMCYITSNNWMRTNYGVNLRAFFAKHNPLLLVNFADLQIFDTATVETNILLMQKSANEGKTLCAMLDSVSNLSEEVKRRSNYTAFIDSSAWVVLKKEEESIKQKFLTSGKLLEDCDVNIVRGILTGYNEAFVITTEKRNQILSRCATEEERRKTEALIVPTLRGRDIKRYACQWAGLWLINTHNGKRGSLSPVDINEYPSVKTYLDQYWSQISKRGDKGVTPYNLRNCAYLDDLTAPKIAWIELSDTPKFTFTTEEIPLNTVFFMVGKDLKYLLGLLNSKAIYWYFTKMLGCTSGMGTNRWLKFTMVQLPIVQVPKDKQQPIIALVDNILAAKKANPHADTSTLEAEIDHLVYDLYDLTEEEIKIVEGTK